MSAGQRHSGKQLNSGGHLEVNESACDEGCDVGGGEGGVSALLPNKAVLICLDCYIMADTVAAHTERTVYTGKTSRGHDTDTKTGLPMLGNHKLIYLETHTCMM